MSRMYPWGFPKKDLNKIRNHEYRKETGDCHLYGLPAGACALKRKLHWSLYRWDVVHIKRRRKA